MVPPFAVAHSRQTRAIFLAAASEIWLPSYTAAAAFALMTYSAATLGFGAAAGAKRGTGAVPGFGFGRDGRSSTSGGTDGPMTSVHPLCAQISSLHTGGRGAEPPTPTAPII